MVSRVIYRPFEEGDFDALAAILQATWHSESPNEAYNRLEATYDLAHALSISSFSQVVLVDGFPRGIVLARAESDRLPYAAAWDQITLLAVSETTRGMGIGSVLLDAAASYVSSRGARGAFLYTDTDCSWKFYERRGLKRAAAYRASREERKLLPREMYLYGLDLSA